MNMLSYPWGIVLGFYFYALFQLLYIARFGSLNTSFSSLDTLLIGIGILSVLMAQYFAKKLPRKRWLMLVPFIVAIPFSYIGALSGGLLGAVGLLIGGLVPFALMLPVGYWLITKNLHPLTLG